MATQGGNQSTARTKRSRRWPWVLLGVILIVVVLVALVPVYLSSDGFRRMIQAKISQSTGGTADIGDLSVGWRKGVRISDFSFREQSGWAAVSIDGIDVQPHLASLLGGTISLGRAVIDRPAVEIDLRKRPAPPPVPAGNSKTSVPPAAGLAMLGDITINDASVHVTDTAGKAVRIAQLNSTLNLRLPGQPSRFEAKMTVGEAADTATVRAAGSVTPDKAAGWTFKGTTGDVVIEVNDLDLESLAPIFELAGVEVQARGRLSANITTAVQDGELETLRAAVAGRNMDITGALLKGDHIQTSKLAVDVRLMRQGQTVQVEQLDARTDWANVTAAGAVPMTVGSLTDLLKSDSSYNLKGNFDCNLPALLSQMPATFGLKEGMQITRGQARGDISTTTEGGRAIVRAQTQITGLAGIVDGKPLALTEPVAANLRLSADDKTVRLDAMDLSAAFAQLTAQGDFNDITYDGRVDLAKFQSELGQFADLGPYRMTGQVTSKGQVAIQDQRIGATGTASLRQLVLTGADGNSVSEPAADVTFAFALDQARQALAVTRLDAEGSFGAVAVKDASIPLDKTSPVPMNVAVSARNIDLQKITPYAVLFASLPQTLRLQGLAQSVLTVTGQEGAYRIRTDDTRIQDFMLSTPGKKPFSEKQVTAAFDVVVNPNTMTRDIETFVLDSGQIKIRFGQIKQARIGDRIRVQGEVQGECDWAAVGQLASPFLPEGLEMSGRREVSLNFASNYPADDPNGLLANLDGSAKVGFDTASYKGLNIGATDVQVNVEKGLMKIEPFSTTVNNGQLNFAGQADFKERHPMLRTSAPLVLAKGIELNKEMTGTLLQYVNPLFANVTGISGIANFECQKLVIPLAAGLERKAEVAGTISADNVLLEASGLLDEILKATGQSLRGQRLTIRPTNLSLQNGIVRYDNMQIDVGDNPLSFSGAIGLDQTLDMTVTLPWTFKGRTARVDKEGQAGQRIGVPLTGTISSPKLDLKKFLQEQLFRGLGDLF
ncbi:MAG TPA: DUF748 domain-containing protein [Sedimentisphaerales bacterium]|nr:DUF748 domain-containing protein [Sedimentisphaerales bacterium]HRS12450.1 DUF748 domain-containing protein [Sedimentisphaerales bacterium]HRV49107.1 DUF748 domain-containing protein [Sedimentisphaerales bacterium]